MSLSYTFNVIGKFRVRWLYNIDEHAIFFGNITSSIGLVGRNNAKIHRYFPRVVPVHSTPTRVDTGVQI